MPRDLHGILLLDKPLGLSSAGAVARAKYLFNARKAGHMGSLDPLASGLLPVCFGEATKFGAQMLDADKTYRVTARLGERTASADLESPVIEKRELPPLATATLEAALAAFPRRYRQIPPMHSALKQDGKPLYEYARAGITRERAAREIAIHSLTLLDWTAPDLSFEVRCSKGAYIRVLAEDFAASIGTVAHLIGLRRLGVAPFAEAARLWSFETLEGLAESERAAALLPVDAALGAVRRLDLSAAGAAVLRQGQPLDTPGTAGSPGAPSATGALVGAPETVRIYADGLGFLGLGELRAAGRLVPLRLVAYER
jgi:tRNA pseudouridine55 synthase